MAKKSGRTGEEIPILRPQPAPKAHQGTHSSAHGCSESLQQSSFGGREQGEQMAYPHSSHRPHPTTHPTNPARPHLPRSLCPSGRSVCLDCFLQADEVCVAVGTHVLGKQRVCHTASRATSSSDIEKLPVDKTPIPTVAFQPRVQTTRVRADYLRNPVTVSNSLQIRIAIDSADS